MRFNLKNNSNIKPEDFDSQEKLDEIMDVFKDNPETEKPSVAIKVFMGIQKILTGIHNNGFKQGYLKGVEIKKTIDNPQDN